MSSDAMDTAGLYKALAWIEKNRKQVIYGVMAVLAIGLVVFFVTWKNSQKQVAAGQTFSEVFAAQSAAGTNAAADPYLKVASQYPDSSAAERALILAATTLFTNGKYAEAQNLFEKFTREHRGSALTGQALLGIAASEEAQGKADLALAAYKDIVDRRAGESILPQAKFQLARLYEGKKDLKQAYDLYKDVSSSDPFGSIGDEASVRMKELEAKDPSLAPAPAASVSIAPAVTNAPKPATTEKK
jgi:tetratricopeptide (TPR) repeat protein